MRKQRKDHRSKVGLAVSIAFHALIIIVVFVWAAKTGRLDPLLKQFDVVLAPKEKKVAAPKPKVVEETKATPPPPAQAQNPNPAPAAAPSTAVAPPPSGVAVAPPAAEPAAFDFSDGAKVVESSTNAPFIYYKSQIEYALRSNWERPPDINDEAFVGEVELRLDKAGRILAHAWKKPSGDKRWDASVDKAIKETPGINRPPPAGFPNSFVVRFDVVPSDPIIQ
jgi:hypothetical protein